MTTLLQLGLNASLKNYVQLICTRTNVNDLETVIIQRTLKSGCRVLPTNLSRSRMNVHCTGVTSHKNTEKYHFSARPQFALN